MSLIDTAREARERKIHDALNAHRIVVTLAANRPGQNKESLIANGVVYHFLKETLDEYPEAALYAAYDALGAWIMLGVDDATAALSAEAVKRFGLELEAGLAGRLLDFDVYEKQAGQIAQVSREALNLPPRRCLLCDDAAMICRREGRHHELELQTAFDETFTMLLADRPLATQLGFMAEIALWSELCRPLGFGSVTLNGPGSHNDMSVRLMFQSIRALGRAFVELTASDVASFEALRAFGQRLEQDLSVVTNGVNTHKGALFHFLFAIAGLLKTRETISSEDGLKVFVEHVSSSIEALALPLMAEVLACDELPDATKATLTGGLRSYLDYGHAGARQEAIRGYHVLLTQWLPRFYANPELAPLLPIMLHRIWDTTTLSRGGIGMVQTLRHMALRATTEDDLVRLSAWCEQYGLSTGGSADMIALLYFFYLAFTWRVFWLAEPQEHVS